MVPSLHSLCSNTDEKSWEAEGLKLDLIEPMKKWSITYQGPMVHQVNKTIHQVELEVSLYTLHMPINTAWTVDDVKVGSH